MAATMSFTRPTTTLKQNMASSPFTCSTTPTGNNNTTASLMYPYLNEEVFITKGIESLESSACYESLKPNARPINLPPGYISISSVTHQRRHSIDSEELVASTKYESDFWPPSFNVFSKRRRRISYAEEALPAEDYSSESSKEEEESPPLRIAERIPSFPSISFPKLPERSWFCNTCRKPKDECNCLCVIS